MSRRKINSEANTEKMREIDAYTHEDKKRCNNPPGGRCAV